MRTFARTVLAALVLLCGCAAPGPQFASVAGTLPPVPPGEARIFVYRWYEPYDTLTTTRVFLNGAPVADSPPGTVLYRDVAPGEYAISVWSEGTFENQFKTVLMKPGDVAYARIESLSNWLPCRGDLSNCGDTFTVVIMNPETARGEMANLRLVNG